MTWKISKREKQAIWIAGVCVAVIILYLAVIEPLWKSQEQVSEHLQEQVQLLMRNHQLISSKDLYQKRYENLSKEVKKLENKLLEGDKPEIAGAQLQKQLTSLAEKIGLTITSKKLLPPINLEIFTEVTVQLEAAGSTRQLRDFLYEMEQKSKELLVIPEIKIQSRRQTRDNMIQVTLLVSGFFKNLASETPVKAETPVKS